MNTALLNLKSELHISASQIFTYLGCSLKYKFLYVEQRPPQHQSISLLFGAAIHRSIERYYRSVMESGQPAPLPLLEALFTETLLLALKNQEAPVLFKREAPDPDSAVELGRKLLATFHHHLDLTGLKVVDVELPLSARLYTEGGEPTDFQLVGVLDLLLQDEQSGDLLVVDHKTAKQKPAQDTADGDLQMSAYCYLLAASGRVYPLSPVRCRFDILQKLKTPKLEHCYTERGPRDRRRFAKLATAVLAGIENRVFIPARSWLCADCQFAAACADW